MNKRLFSINEKGATLVVTALILALLTVFVAAALINTTSSTITTNNDAASTQAFYASYGCLEMMSKNFSELFNINTSPSQAQLDAVAAITPNIPNTTFAANIRRTRSLGTILLETGPYSGLNALRDEFELTCTCTMDSGVQVQVTRQLYNNLIPIFQFAIFSTRHLEFYNGPPFNFGGRVHANGHIYMNNGGALDFSSRITMTGELVRDRMRNGINRGGTGIARVLNSSGTLFVDLTGSGGNYLGSGSILLGPNRGTVDPLGHPRAGNPADNPFFTTNITSQLGGQLIVNSVPLQLPFENGGARPIELIRRGLAADIPTLASSRFFNKPGLRITLSDSRGQLPGGTGGIQLNQPNPTPASATSTGDRRIGYVPRALGAYQASRINGHRIRGWIKVETVAIDNNGTVVTNDVTEAILALGVTRYEGAVAANAPYGLPPNDVDLITARTNLRNAYGTLGNNLDDRFSVIRLQRYELPTYLAAANFDTGGTPPRRLADGNRNHLRPTAAMFPTPPGSATEALLVDDSTTNPDQADTPAIVHQLSNSLTTINSNQAWIAYPITFFDPREGRNLNSANPAANVVEVKGVFSVVEIDMDNLKRLLTGGFDNLFTAGSIPFSASQIGSETNGWIISVSDRRGDVSGGFGENGKYDFETVYGNGTPEYIPAAGQTLFNIEDTNDNGAIEVDTGANGEAAPTTETIDLIEAITKGPWRTAAGRVNLNTIPSTSTGVFRRAVRLTNGQDLSFTGPVSALNNRRGITVASENPVYIQGNYNCNLPLTTSIGNPTPPASYQGPQVPASVISDAVTLLSRNWLDSTSFHSTSRYAVTNRNASTTSYRLAVLSGRPRDGLFGAAQGANDTVMWGVKGSSGGVGPGQEDDDTRLYGGVHNFLRYLEDWSTDDVGNFAPDYPGRNRQTLFYTGSLIDGWDSWQANGTYKCCGLVYEPPFRDYIFDASFLDPARLPPGTPNLQYILLTSFRQNIRPN
ncbi:MAG: hypothetical protein AB1489_16925 [Acidobacteriota bacterium]